jgi:hypothetical protein
MKACLTTSVNYGDILYYTLPRMMANFDRVTVVTDCHDEETAEVTRDCGAELCQTDLFYKDGAMFNKAQATRKGINTLGLGARDWLALVDSDVFLQDDIRPHLRHKARGTLHGCTRRMCTTPWHWRQYLRTGSLRPLKKKNDRTHGVVVGYFQYFSMHGFSRFFPRGYPTPGNRTSAYMIDVDFARPWSGQEWLPFECIHLGPEKVNWDGRTSRRFHHEDCQASA